MQEFYTVTGTVYEDIHVAVAGVLTHGVCDDTAEGMEALGIYEVAPEDFALCEFVDSSKLEVQRIVREGLDMLRKEMA